ncbi:MAG TPA: phosphoribosylaminoimidazolesuccinocarboxamide synthase [Verrucomicrobiae bacterium]|nr:phosphoribosylaminoimidazolesuccinocarboxamide synthase [Verrucomicrobiae bacterium]
MANTITQLDIPGVKKLKSGKVREVFDLGDALLFVASDRISAFDVILPNPIPEKGRVLTALSEFWFSKTKHIVENHFITSKYEKIVARTSRLRSLDSQPGRLRHQLENRSMLVWKCQPLPIECVVRGYLAGSGLKEYKQSQTVCGIKLPAGLVESSQLPRPIFTPATKAEKGHDENISFERCAEILGKPLAEKVRDTALALYNFARDYAAQRGIIIADTKFEFGVVAPGSGASSESAAVPSGKRESAVVEAAVPGGKKLLLIDEALTPDSSRFWPADSYAPGKPQPSFDKQFVRDYLETLDWNKTPPGPVLPDEVVRKTTEKYVEALSRLTK